MYFSEVVNFHVILTSIKTPYRSCSKFLVFCINKHFSEFYTQHSFIGVQMKLNIKYSSIYCHFVQHLTETTQSRGTENFLNCVPNENVSSIQFWQNHRSE